MSKSISFPSLNAQYSIMFWQSVLSLSTLCNILCSIRISHTEMLTALFPRLPVWSGTRKVKPIWILLKQETVSGCGISWAICKSAPHSRQITMPAPHHLVFYRPDALPATQPTASEHWRHNTQHCHILAPGRYACQHPTTQFLKSGCPSCHPTNSVKALKAFSIRILVYKYQDVVGWCAVAFMMRRWCSSFVVIVWWTSEQLAVLSLSLTCLLCIIYV